MTAKNNALRRVLIQADESANWKIGGLPQLERILLGLNEFAARQRDPIAVSIRWNPHIAVADRRFPSNRTLTDITVEDGSNDAPNADQPFDLELTTRAVVLRPAPDESALPILAQEIRNISEIGRFEKKLLRRTGKSQDGIIARNFDRHISRALTRLLLKFPVTPSAWTVIILPVAVAACAAFVYGGRAGLIVGMVLFEIHSLLDGCDGEIARAKYLESESGRRLDTLCDVVADLLLVLGISAGLSRTALSGEAAALFALEGVVAAVVIAFREWLLAKTPAQPVAGNGGAVYERHAHLVKQSGIFGLGERFTAFIIQLTKREVGISFFLLLALIGRGEWILHLLLVFGLISATLTAKASTMRAESKRMARAGIGR